MHVLQNMGVVADCTNSSSSPARVESCKMHFIKKLFQDLKCGRGSNRKNFDLQNLRVSVDKAFVSVDVLQL